MRDEYGVRLKEYSYVAQMLKPTKPPEIVFDPAKHTYHVNGVQVPSVTQVLSVLNKPALTWWGQRIGVEGVMKLRGQGVELPWGDPEGMVKLLTEYRMTVNHVKGQAATRGTSIHEALEAYMRDETVPNVEDFPYEDRGYVQALASALLELNPQIIDAEQVVASVEHGYAGRYDLTAVIGSEVTLLDLKTSKKVYPESHFPQLAAYEFARREMTGGLTDVQAVLLLRADGTWELEKSSATFEDFLGIKSAYDAVQRIKAAVREAKRA